MALVIPSENATQEEINAWIIATQEEYNKMELEVQKKTQREKELEEHNQKLFLRITSKTETKKEDVEEKEIKEYVGDKIYNILGKKEKELLDTIIKGEDE